MVLNIEVSYNEGNKCADVRFINSEGDDLIAPEHINGSKTFKFNIANGEKNDDVKTEINWYDDDHVSVMRTLLKVMGDNELLKQQIDEFMAENHELNNNIEKLRTNQLNSSRKAKSELIDKLVKDIADLKSANVGLAVELAETKDKLEIADGMVKSQAKTISDMKTEHSAMAIKHKYQLNTIYGMSGSATITNTIKEERDLYIDTIKNIARECSGYHSLDASVILDNISEILNKLEDTYPGIFYGILELNHGHGAFVPSNLTDNEIFKDIPVDYSKPSRDEIAVHLMQSLIDDGSKDTVSKAMGKLESMFDFSEDGNGDLIVKIPDCDTWTETVSESSCDAPEKKPEFDSKIPSGIDINDVVYKLDDTTPFYDIGRKNIKSDTIRHLGKLFIADDDLADFNRIFKYTMISRNTFTINDLNNWSSPKDVLKHRFQIEIG